MKEKKKKAESRPNTKKKMIGTFTLEEDGTHVRIVSPGRPGECVRTTTSLGLRLWAAGNGSSARGKGRYAVLSYAIHPARNTGVYVCIGDTTAESPPWPEWYPGAPPAWTAVTEGQWLSVPRTDDPPAAVVDAAARSLKVREKCVADEIQQRCADVVRQGTDNRAQDTLDYYTTLRVKRAFQCMNARDLADRGTDVEKMRVALGALLRDAPSSFAAEWSDLETDHNGTVDDGGEEGVVTDKQENDDPNVLCVPQPNDYAEDHFLLTPVGDSDRPSPGAPLG